MVSSAANHLRHCGSTCRRGRALPRAPVTVPLPVDGRLTAQATLPQATSNEHPPPRHERPSLLPPPVTTRVCQVCRWHMRHSDPDLSTWTESLIDPMASRCNRAPSFRAGQSSRAKPDELPAIRRHKSGHGLTIDDGRSSAGRAGHTSSERSWTRHQFPRSEWGTHCHCQSSAKCPARLVWCDPGSGLGPESSHSSLAEPPPSADLE